MLKTALWWMLILAVPAVQAAEGLWRPEQLPRAPWAAAYGLELSEGWGSSLAASVVPLSNGCTGVLLSDQGLILTTARCASECLTAAEQQDPSREAWQAPGRQAERSCESLHVTVSKETPEVTLSEALVGLPAARVNLPAPAALRLVFYPAAAWLLADDPEQGLAGAPPTPDFDLALLRQTQDLGAGQGPALPTAAESGPGGGQPLFVAGYAARAQRDSWASAVLLRRAQLQTEWLDLAARRGLLYAYAHQHPEASAQVQQASVGLSASLQFAATSYAALTHGDWLAQRQMRELQWRQAQRSDATARSAWAGLDAAMAQAQNLGDAYHWIEQGAGFWSARFAAARQLVRWAEEQQKPDAERLPEFREAVVAETFDALARAQYLDAPLERACLSYSLQQMRESLGAGDAFVRLVLGAATPEQVAARLTADGSLADPRVRAFYLEGGAEAIAASSDPMVQLARAIERPARALRDQWDNEVVMAAQAAADDLSRHAGFGAPRTPQALRAPDADGSVRISVGSLRAWTTERGQPVPPSLPITLPLQASVSLESHKTAAMGVGSRAPAGRWLFLDADAAPGQEGSAVFNRAGELVGLLVRSSMGGTVPALDDDPKRQRLAVLEWQGIQQLLQAQIEDSQLRNELHLPATSPPGGHATASSGAPVPRTSAR